MTQEDKELLLVDLCARLPYGVNVKTTGDNDSYTLLSINTNKNIALIGLNFGDVYATSKIKIDEVKPYLRPIEDMTEEEKENLNLIVDEFGNKWMNSESPLDRWKAAFWEYSEATNYLNSIYIDYRGLIEQGLAIEAPEGMYNNKEEQQ